MCTITNEMTSHPTVFAVAEKYQIFIPFNCSVILYVKVGDKEYYDDSNGILRSHTLVHKVDIPKNVLDEQKEYTVVYRKIIERKPYFPTSEDPVCINYKFRPVKGGKVRIYHISDAHNMEKQPIEAAKKFGDADILVLNGDIPNHSGDVANFNSIYRIASEITKGEIPVLFSRGNHDTRGLYAEKFSDYTPDNYGKPYYTFKLGDVWGMILDCGEDKDDSHPEYGNTVCFHSYRLMQTDFIKNVIENAKREYEAADVKHKIIICHIPFTFCGEGQFKIENDIYREWCELIFGSIKPELLLFGHTHKCGIFKPNSWIDSYGLQNCDAVVGGAPDSKNNKFTGCGITLSDGAAQIVFTDNISDNKN